MTHGNGTLAPVGDAVVPMEEIQRQLGISRNRVYARYRSKPPSLPAHKVGGKWIVYRAEWDLFLKHGLGPALDAGHEREPPAPALDPATVAAKLVRELEGRLVEVTIGDVRFAVRLVAQSGEGRRNGHYLK